MPVHKETEMIHGTYTGVIEVSTGAREAGSFTIIGSMIMGETSTYAFMGEIGTRKENRLVGRVKARPFVIEGDHKLFDGSDQEIEFSGEIRGTELFLDGSVDSNPEITLRAVLTLRRELVS